MSIDIPYMDPVIIHSHVYRSQKAFCIQMDFITKA